MNKTNDNFPTELDNTFCDANEAARVAVAEHIAEMNEAAEQLAADEADARFTDEFLAAARDFVALVDRVEEAYVIAMVDVDHETALMDMGEE